MVATDKAETTKERRMKLYSRRCFDGEVSESIKNGSKLFKKFKNSRLHFDKVLYKTARYMVDKLIFNKKKCILKMNQVDALINRKGYGKP